MHAAIITHIQKFISLSAEDIAIIEAATEITTIKKKEFLFNAGQLCHANYFVVRGCLRLYIDNDKGAEQMIQFGIDNWWITDYMSLNSGRPSEFCLQAVEDSEVIILDTKTRDKLLLQIPALERYFRILTEMAYGAAQMRVHYIFSMSGRERYKHFNERFPQFVQRVPQYLLASYLGISPEFLSRLRAEKE